MLKQILDIIEIVAFVIYGIISCAFTRILLWLATDNWD